MLSAPRLTLAMVLIGASVALPGSAAAFERSSAGDGEEARLFWQFRTVLVHPLYDSSGDVPDAEVAAALSRSIAAWNVAATGCSDLSLVDDGWAGGDATNLDRGPHDSENRIRWRESGWPEEAGPETLALTTLVFRRASGQILDADIDLNGVDHVWSTAEAPAPGQVDVENTLTHELGHLIGLAHVGDPEATMYDQSAPGDIAKRSLAPDEIDAVCTVYPLRGPTPGAPTLGTDGLTGSCAVHSGHAARPPVWLAAMFVLASIVVGRRTNLSRRRSSRRRRP